MDEPAHGSGPGGPAAQDAALLRMNVRRFEHDSVRLLGATGYILRATQCGRNECRRTAQIIDRFSRSRNQPLRVSLPPHRRGWGRFYFVPGRNHGAHGAHLKRQLPAAFKLRRGLAPTVLFRYLSMLTGSATRIDMPVAQILHRHELCTTEPKRCLPGSIDAETFFVAAGDNSAWQIRSGAQPGHPRGVKRIGQTVLVTGEKALIPAENAAQFCPRSTAIPFSLFRSAVLKAGPYPALPFKRCFLKQPGRFVNHAVTGAHARNSADRDSSPA